MTFVNRAVTIALALMVPASAQAQSAGAEALFREGRTLIKQGKLDAGCDKIEQSEKIEPSIGTLLNLGDCREKQQRYATAWAAFRKAEAMAKLKGNEPRRVAEAQHRAERLEDSLARITVQVGPQSKVDGLTITRDGEAVDPDLWGTGIVVDPGSHVIVAEAPNTKPWTTEISVGKGGKRWVVVPSLEPVAKAEPIPPPPAPPPRVVTTPIVPPPNRVVVEQHPVVVEHTWTPTRQLAAGLAVAGAAALAGGIYYGRRATTLESQSDAICPETTCGDPEGLHLNRQANAAARNANIFLIGGGGAIAAATVIWFTGGPGTETRMAPAIGADHVGATVSGRF